MSVSRRYFLHLGIVVGASGLLAACGTSNPAPTSAPPAAQPSVPPPSSPAVAASGAPSPVASPAVAPAASPAASPVPVPSPAAVSSPVTAASHVAAAAPGAGGRPAKQMYQQDAQHSGRSPFAGPRQGNVLRRYDTSTPDNLPPDAIIPRDDFQSSGVVGADGTFFIANFPGVLFALRDDASAANQLQVIWRFHPPAASSFHATPALSSDGKTLYLGFASGGFNAPGSSALYGVNTADGRQVWSADLGATRVMASPTVGSDGTVYVGTAAGQLVAVSADGKINWTAQTRSEE